MPHAERQSRNGHPTLAPTIEGLQIVPVLTETFSNSHAPSGQHPT